MTNTTPEEALRELSVIALGEGTIAQSQYTRELTGVIHQTLREHAEMKEALRTIAYNFDPQRNCDRNIARELLSKHAATIDGAEI